MIATRNGEPLSSSVNETILRSCELQRSHAESACAPLNGGRPTS